MHNAARAKCSEVERVAAVNVPALAEATTTPALHLERVE
mgnify:CR=1 FL=1